MELIFFTGWVWCLLLPVLVLKDFASFMTDAESVRLVGGDLGRQMRWDECPFNGVTNHGRVWRRGEGEQGLECQLPRSRHRERWEQRAPHRAEVEWWAVHGTSRWWPDESSFLPVPLPPARQTDRQACTHTHTHTHTRLELEIKTKIVKEKKIPQRSVSKTLVLLFMFSHKWRTVQELQQFLLKFGVATEKTQLSPLQGLN